MSLSRRRLLTGTAAMAAGAVAAPALLTRPANAAEFTYKLGDVLPMAHPLNGRSVEAAKKILEQSNGKLEIKVYPNSVLGQDTALMSQAISGALQMYVVATDILAERSPLAAVVGTGFAFKNSEQTFAAMDGDLGKYVRGLAEKAGLYCMDKCFDHGFREITSRAKPIRTPDDLKGMKIRLPVAPGMIELFRHLGAAPTAINLGEVYSALQTASSTARKIR
jgi:TRAP-type transport system periplasmic protein